jgi:hypothetical protein
VHGKLGDDQPLRRMDGELFDRADLVVGHRQQVAVDVLGLEASGGGW